MAMQARVTIGLAIWLGPATYAGADEIAAPPDPVGIYGGAPVQACGWPTTVYVNDCTGTLVHPSVVVLAAHCIYYGGQPSEVVFGENFNQPARSVAVDSCAAHPDWTGEAPGDDAADIATCRLSEAVLDVPIVPILMGCETDALQVGASATLVGFGDADDNLGYGPKREVTTQIQQVGHDAVWIGGNGESSCYGDSGGPAFLQLDDGSWRVFGATSGSSSDSPDCGPTSIWTMVHPYAPWIEQFTGIDVTPCHDADGTWNPTETCAGFPMSPGSGGGSWMSGCAGEASGIVETCGPGFGATGTTGGESTDDDGAASSDGAPADDSGGDDDDEGDGTSDDGSEDVDTGDPVPDVTGFLTDTPGADDDGAGCACATSGSVLRRSAPGARAVYGLALLVLGLHRRRRRQA
jgi:hypothetical protein